jgi:hypothetical protein
MEKNIEVKLNKKPSFTEAWFEGSVVYDGQEHKFWLVDPQNEDEEGNKYECEVKWFFKAVPREVRGSYASIIEMYKKIHYDNPPAESSN